MGSYKLVFRKSVTKDLRAIQKQDVARILKRIEALAWNPRPYSSVKLSDREQYRIREGHYRIIYEILDQELVVTVVKVGNRRDIYRDK